MADYIKRIQSRLSRKNIKQSRAVLIDAIAQAGFDHTKLTEDEVNNLTNLLVNKFKVDYERGDDEEGTQKGDCAKPTLRDVNGSQFPISQSDMSENYTPSEHEENIAEIITLEQKQKLIETQSLELGIELSEAEVVELAASVGDSFSDYAEFVKDTALSIKAYANHRYDSLEQQISQTSEDLKKHFLYREKQLDQKLSTELEQINSFFRGKSEKRKQLSKFIATAFKI